jgi:hypothetical protein
LHRRRPPSPGETSAVKCRSAATPDRSTPTATKIATPAFVVVAILGVVFFAVVATSYIDWATRSGREREQVAEV